MAQRDYAALKLGRDGLYWVQYCPEDGRNRIVQLSGGRQRMLTPEGFSVRSRVHEYGGGAWCLAGDRLLFVNDEDQQIWLQPLSCQGRVVPPLRVTDTPDCRYGDLLWDPHRRLVIAVAEQHAQDGVHNRLVAVSPHSGQQRVLAQGHDFYSSPSLSPDGRFLAWLAWDHPHQPWTATRLYRAVLERDGRCHAAELMAGKDATESLFQPGFDDDGVLHVVSDRGGWWNLYRLANGRWRNVCPLDAEFGVAQWQLGLSTWTSPEPGRYGCSLIVNGAGRLLDIGRGGEARRLVAGFSLFRSLCSDSRRLYAIAEAPDRQVAVIAVDRESGALEILAGGERPDHALSSPEAFHCDVGAERVHGFFYPPLEAGAAAPPLLIMTHGGPTATSYPVYRPALQYWTGRGFAVLDLNYRGSAGFGRAYRHRLAGSWGQTDVEDVAAAIGALVERGAVDPARILIRGNSAGGYTTLNALASLGNIRAGASLYGVADPGALRQVTHKFESHYLDWLLGDPEREAQLYRSRSPLHRAEAIRCPVIFFQGARDAVVLPDQTRRMHEALKARGVATELHLFEDEAHGFRLAANQIRVLERELAFYRDQIG
ncbi:peptidase S9 [Marinobacterium nitratireducens]|uniref:Peptidase S9 n=2 Tax=Marinobacterium nitratireducens TaxID=518897 RepID=A0A918DWY1_9GAMM|nr:peptidase S9 [Marinobacterium nitratireducens]